MRKLFDTIDSIGLNRFTLTFNNEQQERVFAREQLNNSLKLFRFSVLSAMISFSVFATLDFIYTRPFLMAETIIGLACIFTIGGLTLYFTMKERLLHYARPTISMAIFLIGVSSIYFLCFDSGEFHFKNYLGLYLVFTFAFSFLKLGFFYSFLPSIMIFILYLFSAFSILNYTTDELIVYLTFLTFSFGLISISGYINEVHLRNEFCLKNELEEERSRVKEQNVILETEVERRTIELLQMNKALVRSKLRAQGSDQLKSAFLANISHEIRTPVTKLVGFSQLMVNDNIPLEKRARYSQNIEDGANQLMQIITDLIELSKIEAHDIFLQKSEFKISVLLDEIMHIANDEIEKQQKIGMIQCVINNETSPSLIVNADKVKLRQILINFINNAVKFTASGSITVSCSERSDNCIEFCVEDTGIGIDEENFELIFNSFRQVDSETSRQFGGAGVGLALNKGLVQAMGGKIWVKSFKGVGSKFHFTLPLYV